MAASHHPRRFAAFTKVAGTLRVPSADSTRTPRRSGAAVTARGACLLHGFTLVELLVVITIIGMLMALLIPAVGAARARARQNSCLNNMTNMGKAVISFEQSKGHYPGYIQAVKRGIDPNTDAKTFLVVGQPMGQPMMSSALFRSSNPYTNASQEAQRRIESKISWAAVILPQMDQQALWDILLDPGASQAQSKVVPQPVYICPEDNEVSNSPDNAGLSYCANAGSWDFQSSNYISPGPTQGDTPDNGLFHNLSVGRVAGKASNIRDGAATTLLLSENIHKNQNYSWLGVTQGQPGEQHFGMVWVVNTAQTRNANDLQDEEQQVPFSAEPEPPGDFVEERPWFARPASAHPGGSFNVIFADSHGRSIDPNIDYTVYQQLITPNGRKCVDPSDWTNNGPEMQTFRTAAPVSEKDLE